MTDFVAALGLLLVIEGVVYALFPNAMQQMLADILSRPPQLLRTGGLIAACVGVGIVWLARG